MTDLDPADQPSRTPLAAGLVALVLALLVGGSLFVASSPVRLARLRTSETGPAWPTTGQAAVRLPDIGDLVGSGVERPVPIASLTKVMTALVVLDRLPMASDEDGVTLTVSEQLAEETARGRTRGESVVPVIAGERITERDALLALLLPSANNMARLLADRVAGSEGRFVDLMNERAGSLDLRATSYADSSGFDRRSVSTAHDQVLLAEAAMRNPTFAWLVRQSTATVPVAGALDTTDRLLGRDGYVGIKAGSHAAAGGCFVFAVARRVDGRRVLIIGTVLGQRGPDLLAAAFAATTTLVDSLGER